MKYDKKTANKKEEKAEDSYAYSDVTKKETKSDSIFADSYGLTNETKTKKMKSPKIVKDLKHEVKNRSKDIF